MTKSGTQWREARQQDCRMARKYLMKIVGVDLFPFEVPLVAPFRIATMECAVAYGVFVRLRTDVGLVGWGEATPLQAINGETQSTCMAALPLLIPVVLGEDPLSVAALVERMEHILPGHGAAASAIEMGLYDLAGKATGMPLWRMLGGAPRRLATDQTIGIKSSEEAVADAERIVSMGHRAIKIKVGSGANEDFERVRLVREAIGTAASIRVDANQGFRRDEALSFLKQIAPFDVEFCEQPVRRDDLVGMSCLNAKSPVPIMADESLFTPADAMHLLREKACALFNIKLSKARGILRGLEIAAIAEAAKIPCMIGGMVETRLGVTAAAHLGASRPIFQYFDLDANMGHRTDVIVGGIRIERGEVVLPDSPGLGAEPDPAFLRQISVVKNDN